MPINYIYTDYYGGKCGSLRRYQYGGGETYAFIRENPTASESFIESSDPLIGQRGPAGDYLLYRAYLTFNTAIIPTGTIIKNAKLELSFFNLSLVDTDFDIVVQNGQPDYPHYPAVVGDYYFGHYSGDGGSMNTQWILLPDVYYNLPFNANGINWINKEGETKLLLRSSKDIGAVAPTGEERLSVVTAHSAPHPNRARLVIEWEYPKGKASITTNVEVNLSQIPDSALNIKAIPDSTQTAIRLYGEIIKGTNIIEKGFEYIIQDEEPTAEAEGIEVIKEKPEHIEFWEIGEYWAYEYEGNDVAFDDRLYRLEENTIWWFRAYFKDNAENKVAAETWMKNVPTVLVYECSGHIGGISLVEAGTGYSQYDTLNIIQTGATGGTAKVNEVGESGEILSISIYNVGENYKIENGLLPTGGDGEGAIINITSVEHESQQITANGELLDKGASEEVTRRGFRIIKEYEGDLEGLRYYDNPFGGFILLGEIEMETLINENDGSIKGYIWRGTFYRDSLWPKSQTPGDFEVGVYDNILGGGISGEGFGFYLKSNDTYKIIAIAVNSLGMGFGDDSYFYTYNRLEGGNIGNEDEGKIDIEGEGGAWEEDGEGIWWKAGNILEEYAIAKTSIIILPSDDEIVSEISAEKTITLGTIPDGATVTRIGIRLGRTEGCNEIHVFEDGSWGTGGSVTFYITDFVPEATYYKMPYIIINYGDYEEEILAIPDYRNPERLEEWLEDYPLEVFPEVEDEDDLDQTIIDSSVGDISYRTIIKEIKCEKIGEQSFIDRWGRRRSKTISNHLIQSRVNCIIIADDYIERFQILKLKIEIDYDIPIPFEREDIILLGDGKHKLREDGEGLIPCKDDGEGEILQEDFILAKIRKIDPRFISGSETILSLELEV